MDIDSHQIQVSLLEQRQKQILSVRRRFAAALRRVVFLLKFNVPDLRDKLHQDNVDLNNPEDAAFIKTLLIKEDRTLIEIEYLKKAFRKMKFFQQQAQILQPETYNKIFASVRYIRKRQHEILFTYGQRDFTYFIILKGSVTLLVPNSTLSENINNNTVSLREIKLKTKELLIKYTDKAKRLDEKREWHEIEVNAHHQQKVITKKNYLGQIIEETGGFEKYLHAIFPDFEILKNMYIGDSFGEVAVLNRSHRTGSVVCREECDFMILDANSFDQILRAQEFQTLKIRNIFVSKLKETKNISETKRNDLIHSIRIINYKLFDVIYKEGQQTQDIFYIYNGEVELSKTIQNGQQGKNKEKNKIKISLCTQNSIIGLEDMHGNQLRTLTATCNSRVCTLYALPKIAFLNCISEKERQNNQTKNDWRCNQIVNSVILSQNMVEQKQQEQLKLLTKEQKDSYSHYLEAAIQQQVSKNHQQIIKREQIIEKLYSNSIRQGYQAFLKDSELQQKHISFSQKITAIKDGYFFSEDTENIKRLNMLMRIRKKVFQKNLEQFEFIPRQSRVNSQPLKNSVNLFLLSEVNDQMSKKTEEIQDTGENKSISKLHRSQISLGETDQDYRLPSNSRSQRVMSTTQNEPKRKRVLYSKILKKSNEQKKRQQDQYSNQGTQENSQQLQPKILINYRPVEQQTEEKQKKSTSLSYLKRSQVTVKPFRHFTLGDINSQIKSMRMFIN